MPILITTNSGVNPGLKSRIAVRFPFIDMARVAPHLAIHGRISVQPDGIHADQPIAKTRIFAAQLAALGVHEIRITPDVIALYLLTKIAQTKELPSWETVTVVDIATNEGIIAYATNEQLGIDDLLVAINQAPKSIKTTIFSHLLSKDRIALIVRHDTINKALLVPELISAEREVAISRLIALLPEAPRTRGFRYIAALRLLGYE